MKTLDQIKESLKLKRKLAVSKESKIRNDIKNCKSDAAAEILLIEKKRDSEVEKMKQDIAEMNHAIESEEIIIGFLKEESKNISELLPYKTWVYCGVHPWIHAKTRQEAVALYRNAEVNKVLQEETTEEHCRMCNLHSEYPDVCGYCPIGDEI